MQIVFRKRHNNLFAWDAQPMENENIEDLILLKYICHAMSWTELFDTDVCSIAMASLYFAATQCTRHALH